MTDDQLDQVFRDFPEAAPLRDLFADTESIEEVRELASAIAERLQTEPADSIRQPTVTVDAGGTARAVPDPDGVAEAITAGDWSGYLRAKNSGAPLLQPPR